MMSWLTLLFSAPIIGIRKRWPNVYHAITIDGVGETMIADKRSFQSACGLSGLRLVEGNYPEADGGPYPALWPPRIKGMPDDQTRCRVCWEQTGKQRPRTEWAPQT